MPEQTAISITVTIAPQVAHGLHALVLKAMTEVAARTKPEDTRRTSRTVVNSHKGTVHGTLFQIGNVEGDIHHHGDR